MYVKECPVCLTPTNAPEWKARTTYLWANQHGQEERVFCDVCGAWSDVMTLGDKITTRVLTTHSPIEILLRGDMRVSLNWQEHMNRWSFGFVDEDDEDEGRSCYQPCLLFGVHPQPLILEGIWQYHLPLPLNASLNELYHTWEDINHPSSPYAEDVYTDDNNR